MPGFQNRSQNAIPTWLADDDGNALGSVANPLNVSSGGGGTQQVQGNVANGTADSGNPVKVGGIYSTATNLTSLTAGVRADAQFDIYGNLRARLVGAYATPVATGTNVVLAQSNLSNAAVNGGPLGVLGYNWNGTNTLPSAGDATATYTKNPPRTKNASGVTAGSTTSQQLFAANTTRNRLLIQNQDASINVFVNLGATAVAGAGNLRIAPGATLDLTGTSEAVNLIAASGTPAISAWEF